MRNLADLAGLMGMLALAGALVFAFGLCVLVAWKLLILWCSL